MEELKTKKIRDLKTKADFKMVSVKITNKQYKYMKAQGLNMSRLLRMSIDELMK